MALTFAPPLLLALTWPSEPPGVPCNVSVSVGAHQALLQWSHAPPSEGGLAVNFAVMWQLDSATKAKWSEDIDVTTTQFELDGLASGKLYGFRLTAYNKLGQVRSAIHRFTTLSTLGCKPTGGRAFVGLVQPEDEECIEMADDDETDHTLDPELESLQDCGVCAGDSPPHALPGCQKATHAPRRHGLPLT